jgi:hypothetical protein
MIRLHLLIIILAANSLIAGTILAQEPATATSQTFDADLKELNDPTILSRRVWLEKEWNHFDDSSNVVEDTFGALWAWRLSDTADWAVRLKLPVKYRFGSDDPDISDIGGLGDMKVAAGAAARLSDNWRIGGGVDLEFPTGRHELSDNAWRIQEFVAVGWDITPKFTFSPSLEYNQSLSTEGSAADIHSLEIFAPFTFVLPDKWAIGAGYENKADFENDADTHRGKIFVVKELTNVPLSFALSAKRDFNGGPKEFQVNFVLTYFFRTKAVQPSAPAPYTK